MNSKFKQTFQKINMDIEEYKQDLQLDNFNEQENECYIHVDLTKGDI